MRKRPTGDYGDWEPRSARRRTPTSRVYVHRHCGTETIVGDSAFRHICDPFWPCTGTYCCQCDDYSPLHHVRWADTEERISDFRQRMRENTPALVKVWRYGGGLIVGGLIGSAPAILAAVLTRFPWQSLICVGIAGMTIGAIATYLLGTLLLNIAFGIDYCRMR